MWLWYNGGDRSAVYSTVVQLDDNTKVLIGYMPASELGVGSHRVEFYMDGKMLDDRAFEVTQ